jgi:hypothetical protein
LLASEQRLVDMEIALWQPSGCIPINCDLPHSIHHPMREPARKTIYSKRTLAPIANS